MCCNQRQMDDSDETEASPQISVPALASIIAASFAAIFALTVLAGWEYTRAYYEQFHIPSSSLHFSPFEYALRSQFVFSSLIVMFTSAAVGFALSVTANRVSPEHWLHRFARPDYEPKELSYLYGTEVLLFAALFVFSVVDWYVLKRGTYLYTFPMAAGIWGIVVIAMLTNRRAEFSFLAYVSLVALVAFLILFMPGATGEMDGRRDRDHPDKLPVVSVFLRDQSSAVSETLSKGEFRLVLHQSGVYYLLPEDENADLMAVPEDLLAYMTIAR